MSSATFGSVSINSVWLHKLEFKAMRWFSSPCRSIGRFVAAKLAVYEGEDRCFGEIGLDWVLGASGYTGAEIVRLLANHPHFDITTMTADRKAGRSIGSVFPHLMTQDLPAMVSIKDADFSNVDAVFCCLPHGTTQEIIKGLPKQLKIVDLSAKEAVYGLTEVFRGQTRNARLVANPGCYPTSIQLPLVPLIKAGLIELRSIIIVAKSGVSGAGRGAKEANLYTEVSEGLHSYGITKHRHEPWNAINHICRNGTWVTTDDLYLQLLSAYKDEEFVRLLEKGVVPHTRHVRGSNYCFMNVFEDRIPSIAIIISVVRIFSDLKYHQTIDNLVKGASGQALQNLNLMVGFPENMGLDYQPLFP